MAKKKGKMKKAIDKALNEPVLDLSLDGEEGTEGELRDDVLNEEAQKAKEMKEAYFNRMHSYGRPRAYESVDALVTDAMDYIVHCAAAYQMPNKAGLSVWMHIDPATLRRWAAEEDGIFRAAIKRIHDIIEDKWVQQLGNPFNRNASGVIFYLKNAFKHKFRDSYSTDLRNNGKAVTFVLPAEIAQKHSVTAIEAPKEEEKKDEVVEPQPTEQGEVVGAA